jgi:hypothetical protein
VNSNLPYTDLKTAFRYRKEYVQGCSCKVAEFVPQSQAPQQSGQAPQSAPVPPGAAGATASKRAESIGGDGWSTAIEPQ